MRLFAPAVKCLPLPWMRSERKTSASGDVALARALQASRFAASAGAVEATAPTLEKLVSVANKDGLVVKVLHISDQVILRSYV